MTFHLPHLPIEDPVLIFALAMGIFLLVPIVFERLRIPGIIGIIVAGAAIGPHALGVLERDETIVLLGTVGLLYLMFMVGLELDLNEFGRNRNHSLIFGAISFLLPQLAGTGLGLALGLGLFSSLLLGSAWASHTLLAYPIVSRLGIVTNKAVTVALGGTIVTEILALLVLAIAAGAATGDGIGLTFWAILIGSLTVYTALVLWGLPRLGRFFFRNSRGEAGPEFIFVMMAAFTVAYLAHVAGVEPIIGALLAGLALNRLIPHQGPLMNRIVFIGNALFIPFFLLSVGMLVDVRAFATPATLLFAVAVTVGVILTKWIASKVTERAFGYGTDEGWTMFGLSVPHAAGTMAIVLVGFDVGLLDQAEVNAIVLVILVTSLLGPWVTEKYGRQVAMREEQKPYEPSEAPQRILIPISNPATEDALLDLALTIRSGGSEEPLYPLMVVRDDPHSTEAQVAEAERLLGHAVIYAAGADVPVVPLARVDRSIPRGIARGIAETRSSVVVIGWDAGRSGGTQMFGSVLDQLLEQTKQTVLVAKLGHPLNTTHRLVLVLPPGIDHHPGFFDALRLTKHMAGRLGASILGIVVVSDPQTYQEHFEVVKPDVPMNLAGVQRWSALPDELRSRLAPDDLVVVLSARRGTLPWHRALERLPRLLAHLGPESFIMMYPSEVESASATAPTAAILPGTLEPEQVILDLPPVPFSETLEELLGSSFGAHSAVRRSVVEALAQREREFSSEVVPGVMVPHARVEGLTSPLLFLGVSPEGIRFANSERRAQLIFLLISPIQHPEEHLRHLAEIARILSQPERVREMLGSQSPDELVAILRGEGVPA